MMMSCNHIRKRIDEADKPDRLPFDITEHIGRCGDCERFAAGRAGLRNLLSSGVRVNAPINFDAMLNRRLAEAKARPSFSWLGLPGYMRIGTAVAGLAVMIIAVQYSGLFSDQSNEPGAQDISGTAITKESSPVATAKPPAVTPPAEATGRAGVPFEAVSYAPAPRPRGRRTDVVLSRPPVPAGYLSAEDGGVVLVRGRNGEMDVPMPTVSVGAQPLLYVSAGQRATRNIGTSF